MAGQHKKRAMLAALRQLGNISQAAEAAGCSRSAHYLWLRTDPRYHAEVADAMEEAADHLEAEARRRAVEGTEEPVYYQGKPVGAIRRYSDLLLIFLLKAARPEKFRERVEHYAPERVEAYARELAERLGLDPDEVAREVERLREEVGRPGASRRWAQQQAAAQTPVQVEGR